MDAAGLDEGGEAGGEPAGLKPAPWDHLAHHPRYGYPRRTAEELAETIRGDRERWERGGRRLAQRPASSLYRDPRKALRLR